MFGPSKKMIEDERVKENKRLAIIIKELSLENAQLKEANGEIPSLNKQIDFLVEEVNHLKKPESLMILMTKYKLNNLTVDGVKIEKLYHEFPEQEKKNTKTFESMTDEELLFMSAE